MARTATVHLTGPVRPAGTDRGGDGQRRWQWSC